MGAENNFWKQTVMKYIEKAGSVANFDIVRQAARDYVYKLREQGRISFSEPEEGHLPSVHLVRRTVPEAWEDMTMAILGIGQLVHTHYDPGHKKGEYESFPSMEVTGSLHVTEPQGEPRFHKHYLGGWLGFGDYKAEIEGIKDHWVLNPEIVVDMLKKKRFKEIKDHTGWLYSYSQRFRAYPFIDIHGQPQVINQLQSVIDNLSREPTSRSAQCITWDPRWDHNDGQMRQRDKRGRGIKAKFSGYHAPCLQSLWFRLEPFEDGYKLNTNGRFRSWCHLKGLPSNLYGIHEGMIEHVRTALQDALKVPVGTARDFWTGDTLHAYGHYLDPRMQGKDAEAYLADILRVAAGEPLENRLILPGTLMYEAMQEDIRQEYQERKSNPNKGKNF